MVRRLLPVFGWLLFAFLCVTSLPSAAAAEPDDAAVTVLEQIQFPRILGKADFEYQGVSFQKLLIPQYRLEQYADSDYAFFPGDTDERVGKLKKTLNSDSQYAEFFRDNEYVTYSQIRPEVVNCFDAHLETLLGTIYEFCGIPDKQPCVDELTCWIIENLKTVSSDMRHDIEQVYKYKLTKSGTYGTVLRDGSLDNLYYFAQTDSDWCDEIFEFEGNGATLKDRGCGCACAAMVFSTYHKVEITPKWMRFYAVQDDYPVSYGLPNEYFTGIAKYYMNLETGRYGTVLNSPRIIKKADIDIQSLIDGIANKGYMAIIHVVAGAFTSHEHYMVLCGYKEIDGTGYFLVADPYEMPSRYKDWDQLRTVDSTNVGLIYATTDVLYRDMKSVILFEQNKNEFPLYSRMTDPEELERAS